MSETKIVGRGEVPGGVGRHVNGGDDKSGGSERATGGPARQDSSSSSGRAANNHGARQTDGRERSAKFDKPDKADKPARAQEVESQGRQLRSKLEHTHGRDSNHEQTRGTNSELKDARARDSNLRDDATRGERIRQSDTRNLSENSFRRETSNDRESHGDASGRQHTDDYSSGPRHDSKLFRSRGDDGDQHGGGRHQLDLSEPKESVRTLSSSATDYLRGRKEDAELSPKMRHVLKTASELLGDDLRDALSAGRKDRAKAFRIVERAVEHISHEIEHTGHESGRGSGRVGQVVNSSEQFTRGAVEELAEAIQLNRYFKQLEKGGGTVIRQAEDAVARILYGERRESYPVISRQRIYPGEVLRDLRSGAFLLPEASQNPFPLTGRARVVTEAMELMRTLDAVERVTQEMADGRAQAALPENAEELLVTYLRSSTPAGEVSLEIVDGLMAALLPALPGRAARVEVLRLIMALDGALTDAEGRVLTSKDGTALRLDQLLWLATLTGTARSSSGAEAFPARLSPLLIYGFDAIYSVIGFDGRTLNPPHFSAVQAQVNCSEPEWVYGQPPLSAGWMRALIERLKDSFSADHNLLGEMLEEALTDGRFHAVLVSGSVEEGEPVSDSFSITKLLAGASGEAAFSPA